MQNKKQTQIITYSIDKKNKAEMDGGWWWYRKKKVNYQRRRNIEHTKQPTTQKMQVKTYKAILT